MEKYNSNWVVYIHTNKINGKMYVGITSQKPKRRWGFNGKGYKGCVKFVNAIKKLLISSFDTINKGYNQEPGGIGGSKSEEARNKIREARKKQVFTPEAIAKSAESHRGLKRDEETIIRMREAKRSKYKSVKCLETGEIFCSISEAARAKELSPSGIYRSCRYFETKTPSRNRGLHWKFVD